MTKSQKLVFSLIVPCYNEEKYLGRCLDSIFGQTLAADRYEVIVIDDGSTDGSVAIAEQYRVRLLRTKRQMAGGARNLGFAHAKGEYLLLLDADDYLADAQVLRILADQLNHVDLAFVKVQRIKEQQVTIITENPAWSLDEQIAASSNFCLTMKCFRRDLAAGVTYQAGCYHEDIAFVMELLCCARSVLYFDRVLYVYDQDTNAVIADYSLQKAVNFLQQTLQYYVLVEQYPARRMALRQRIANEGYQAKIAKLSYWLTAEQPLSYHEFLH